MILDRYVASNAAYSAARLHQGADGDIVAWVRSSSTSGSSFRRPTRRCCSTCRPSSPPQRADDRARQEADRAKDAYERDDGLQRRTGDVYAALAAADWYGPWHGRRSGRRRAPRWPSQLGQ